MPAGSPSDPTAPFVMDPTTGRVHPQLGFGGTQTVSPGDPGHLELLGLLNDTARARAQGLPYAEVRRIYDEGLAKYKAAIAANPPPTITQPSTNYYSGGFDAPHPLRSNWLNLSPASSAPVAASNVPAIQPAAPTTGQPSQPLAQLLSPAQPLSSTIIGRLPSGPSETQPVQPQPSPLMQLLNFPRLRTKKPYQTAGGTAPGGVGQYNENFWNAWRL